MVRERPVSGIVIDSAKLVTSRTSSARDATTHLKTLRRDYPSVGTVVVARPATLYVFSDGTFEIQHPDGAPWSDGEFVALLTAGGGGRNEMDAVYEKADEIRQDFEDAAAERKAQKERAAAEEKRREDAKKAERAIDDELAALKAKVERDG